MMIQCLYCGNIEENRGICSACGKIIIKEFEQENETYEKHPCPKCGNGMLVLQYNGKTRFPFYGCSNYPHCRYTESIDNKQPTKSCKNKNSEKITAESTLTYQEKQDVSAIRGEITAELIKELLKKHFMQTYTEEAFEQAFSTVHIEITDKATDVFEKHPATAMVRTHECAEIRIKGHAFDLYMNPHHGDTIFQDFVQRTIADLLKWNLIPATEIEKLQKFDYSKETFGLQYALFQKDWKDCLDNTGKPRYWAKKIGIFFVCSQWWKEKVVPVYEDKFAEWLRYLSRICDNG